MTDQSQWTKEDSMKMFPSYGRFLLSQDEVFRRRLLQIFVAIAMEVITSTNDAVQARDQRLIFARKILKNPNIETSVLVSGIVTMENVTFEMCDSDLTDVAKDVFYIYAGGEY